MQLPTSREKIPRVFQNASIEESRDLGMAWESDEYQSLNGDRRILLRGKQMGEKKFKWWAIQDSNL